MKLNFIGMYSVRTVGRPLLPPVPRCRLTRPPVRLLPYPAGFGAGYSESTDWIGETSSLSGERVVAPYGSSFITTLKQVQSYVPKNTSSYTGGGALASQTSAAAG